MSGSWPWGALGLDGPADERAVKSAYAKRLKQIDRADPEAFQALRAAFEAARRRAPKQDAAPRRQRPKMAQIGAEVAAEAAPVPPAAPPLREVAEHAETPAPPETRQALDLPVEAETPAPPATPLDAPDTPTAEPAPWQARLSVPPAPPVQPAVPMEPEADPGPDPEDTLRELEQALDVIWPDASGHMRPDAMRTLDRVLAEAGNLPGYLKRRLEMRLALGLTNHGVTPSPHLATILDRHLGWVRDATTVQHRLSRVRGLEPFIARLAVALPRPKKSWRQRYLERGGEPLTLGEISYAQAALIILFLSVVKTIADDDEPVVVFFLTVSISTMGIYLAFLAYAAVWYLTVIVLGLVIITLRKLRVDWMLGWVWGRAGGRIPDQWKRLLSVHGLVPSGLRRQWRRREPTWQSICGMLASLTVLFVMLLADK